MRQLVLLIGLVVTLFAAASAAAETAKDARAVILQRSDLPATADYSSNPLPVGTVKGLAAIGIRATGATFHASVEVTPTKARSYDGVVFLTGSAAQAAKLYALSVREAKKRPNKAVTLRLPNYGNAQFARYFVGASSVELLVRRNGVVWILQLAGTGLLVRSQAELTAELKTYASRQARRLAG